MVIAAALGALVYNSSPKSSFAQTADEETQEELTACLSKTGKIIQGNPCYKNTVTGQLLCYILQNKTERVYLSGASDRLDQKIIKNINKKVTVQGTLIKKGNPPYLIVGSLVVNIGPTSPTNE